MTSRAIGVEVVLGDITNLNIDAVVNAANELMLGGGGVDGAIHAVAGPELYEACLAIPEVKPDVRCPTGESRITPAFNLPAKFVIHTVGPIWGGGSLNEDVKLASCYRSALALAREYSVESIAFPAISCGVYGFPPRRAARIAVSTISECMSHENAVVSVLLLAFEKDMYGILREAIG